MKLFELLVRGGFKSPNFPKSWSVSVAALREAVLVRAFIFGQDLGFRDSAAIVYGGQ